MNQIRLTCITQHTASFVVAFNPWHLAHRNNSTHRNKMSQVATIANSELDTATIGAENTDPNTGSAVLPKAKENTEENLICSENMRSESSTPVKEIVEVQPAPENQIAGNSFSRSFPSTFFAMLLFLKRSVLFDATSFMVIEPFCFFKSVVR